MRTVPMIVGTDWWTDCDDCMAMRILANMHKRGVIKLLGIGMNACMEHSVCSLDGFLRNEGIDVPIGIDLKATDFTGNPPFQKILSQVTDSKYSGNSDAPDAVALYRRLLASATEPVQIIEIGFLQVLSNLLKSEPDDISPLSGLELVSAKVEKFWVMAGKWDEPEGLEHNFCNNDRARRAAHELCRLCPKPITFLGWEVSNEILCGSGLSEDDPLYLAMKAHGSQKGRSSWDPMLCLLACLQDEERAGYRLQRGVASVDKISGANTFTPDENGPHGYVIKQKDDDFYRYMVDAILHDNKYENNSK